MARTTKQTKTNATSGFAIEIKDGTELGLAILVAEFGDGNYQPVGVVVSINEAREIAASDMRGRVSDHERGKTPACPERYLVAAPGFMPSLPTRCSSAGRESRLRPQQSRDEP